MERLQWEVSLHLGSLQDTALHCSVLPYSTLHCSNALHYTAFHYTAVQYSAVQYSTMQCSAVQCSTVQCSAVQCSTVQCSKGQGRGEYYHALLITPTAFSSAWVTAVQCCNLDYRALQCALVTVHCSGVYLLKSTAVYTLFLNRLQSVHLYIFAVHTYCRPEQFGPTAVAQSAVYRELYILQLPNSAYTSLGLFLQFIEPSCPMSYVPAKCSEFHHRVLLANSLLHWTTVH